MLALHDEPALSHFDIVGVGTQKKFRLFLRHPFNALAIHTLINFVAGRVGAFWERRIACSFCGRTMFASRHPANRLG